MAGMPPLSLSTGPAVSTGGPTGGGTATGPFNITRRDPVNGTQEAIRAIPLVIGAIALIWIFNRR